MMRNEEWEVLIYLLRTGMYRKDVGKEQQDDRYYKKKNIPPTEVVRSYQANFSFVSA